MKLTGLGPSLHPRETDIGINMVDACVEEKKSGQLQHFVYSSVLNTFIRKMVNHDRKRYVEERLHESGLSWTILSPTNFMDVFPVQTWLEQDRPVFQAIWDPSKPSSLIALFDLADAAAKVIQEREKHFFAIYPLCGTLPISYNDAILQMGGELGKDIKVEYQGFRERIDIFGKNLTHSDSMSPGVYDGAERLVLFYERKGLHGSPNVLAWLLGRAPLDCKAFARQAREQSSST